MSHLNTFLLAGLVFLYPLADALGNPYAGIWFMAVAAVAASALAAWAKDRANKQEKT